MFILKEDLFEEKPANGINSLLIDAISREWESIENLKSLGVTMSAEGFDEMTPVVESILADKNNHIGQLQQLLVELLPPAEEIEQGKEDALEIMGDDIDFDSVNESLMTESYEKEVYDWLEKNWGSDDCKKSFRKYVDNLKSSDNNTVDLTKDINLAIKKFAKKSNMKPQSFMSALKESLRNDSNIERNKKLAKGELTTESLREDIDENADKYYVSYYEETPSYHPEDGGYYVATCSLINSNEFDNLEDARNGIAELAEEDGLVEKITDEFYLERSKYIGGDRFYIVETEQGSEEKGDTIVNDYSESTEQGTL